MLTYKNRIIKREDFARIKKHGQAYFSGNIELKIAENSPQETRIGFIVGMQFSKKAVERNRARRQAQETFRHYLPKIAKHKEILVVIRKKGPARTEKEDIKENIKKALRKAGIIE